MLLGFAAPAPAPAQMEMPEPTTLVELSSAADCNRCTGTLLKGAYVPNPAAKWGMISDLPESFKNYGVLYSTREQLPPNGGAEELLRQRRAGGFEVIDGTFDVFIFHLMIKAPQQAARIVVHAKNLGDEPLVINPGQVIRTEGIIAAVHEFESGIATRVLNNDWDRPVGKVTIPPGEGRVIAYGKRFGNIETGEDASRNVNCFGYVRGAVESPADPRIEVSVVAIPPTKIAEIEAVTAQHLDQGADSTDEVPMDSEPQGCQLRRAVGVYGNGIWRNEPMVIDVARLGGETVRFPMALPDIQTSGCADARQTTDLVLRPGFTREDTIGNYMMEYDVRITLVNTGEMAHEADISYRKDDADIGLAFMLNTNADPESPTEKVYEGLQAVAQWAGPKQSAREKSFLPELLRLEPGTQRTIGVRFMIVGNSSLPFFLSVTGANAEPGADTPH